MYSKNSSQLQFIDVHRKRSSHVSEKNQIIRNVTEKLLAVSVPPLPQAIKVLENKYNPYHRVYYPFTVLFQKTDFPELKHLDQDQVANGFGTSSNSRLPETVMSRGVRVNINQILDNTNYYMKPVDRKARESGYQGAFIEDFGISFTIPDNQLTPKLLSFAQEYNDILGKYQIPKSDLRQLIREALVNWKLTRQHEDQKEITDEQSPDYPHFKGRVINHLKQTFTGQIPPTNFLHKLRRDLSKYYKNLGYMTEVRNRDGYRIKKSCDFYHDRNLDSDSEPDEECQDSENLPTGVMVLKIYFSPDKAREILAQG